MKIEEGLVRCKNLDSMADIETSTVNECYRSVLLQAFRLEHVEGNQQ